MQTKVDLQDIIADLEEAKGFAAMSPAGRDNIASALDGLHDAAEETYRKGFVDGELHAAKPSINAGSGMDLRDYFAAQIFPDVRQQVSAFSSTDYNLMAIKLKASDSKNLIALMAYEYADAMISARRVEL